MDKNINKVKQILDQILIKYPVDDFLHRENINKRYAEEICHLFSGTPDNPDGYEPKPDKVRGK